MYAKLLPTLLLAAIAAGAPGDRPGPDVPHAPHVLALPAMLDADPADPADSLHRDARDAMSRGDFRRAATLFARLPDRYPGSAYAADAYYWQAFALYRVGGTSELKRALKALKAQKERYPKAKTTGDANALETRIQGQLARQGDAASAEDVTREAGEATKAVGCSTDESDESDMRVAALNALLQMDSERAMPILKQVLAKRDRCSVGLRRKAVFLVSQKRSSETETLLLDVARRDPDLEVRKQAIFWLGQVHSERAISALDSVIRDAEDPQVREQAVFAISQQRSERAGPILRRLAEDTAQTFEVREKAVFWLGQQRSPENATALREMFARTRSDELRDKILFSLSQMRGYGNDEWLLGIAAEPRYSVEVRKQAIFSAGQNRVATAALVTLYDRLTERELKEQAIWVMSEQRDGAGIEKLIAIAKTDKDPELRKKAIFWLGQSRDPRVQQLLLEIING